GALRCASRLHDPSPAPPRREAGAPGRPTFRHSSHGPLTIFRIIMGRKLGFPPASALPPGPRFDIPQRLRDESKPGGVARIREAAPLAGPRGRSRGVGPAPVGGLPPGPALARRPDGVAGAAPERRGGGGAGPLAEPTRGARPAGGPEEPRSF